jgi:hypothetical protein
MLPEAGDDLPGYGVDAIWMGSGSLTTEGVARLQGRGVRVYAEFNTMHHAPFLERHPDAAPVGTDGRVCPPPDGWQGVCPTHAGYRADRMAAFRAALADFAIDGIWLDYHHSHASWEQATPNLPDTCFCPRCLAAFQAETGNTLPAQDAAAVLLGPLRTAWTAWRCAVFTDWVRAFRAIRDAVRPDALLGTFHCPWTDSERDGALTKRLALDLRTQREHIDVFSPMPYHARFGHATDTGWIARQGLWLGGFLEIGGDPGPAVARGPKHLWPIVQLSDWGESVPQEQVTDVLHAGTQPPATGITVFAWGSLQEQPEKINALTAFYRALQDASRQS